MRIDRKNFDTWLNQPKNFDFKNAWVLGKQACQTYHEDLMRRMIMGELINGKTADSKSKELQFKWLQSMFKEDWADKHESKVEVTNKFEGMSKEDQIARIQSIASKAIIKNLVEVTKPIDDTDVNITH